MKDYESRILYNDKHLNIDWGIDEKDLILSKKDKVLIHINGKQEKYFSYWFKGSAWTSDKNIAHKFLNYNFYFKIKQLNITKFDLLYSCIEENE